VCTVPIRAARGQPITSMDRVIYRVCLRLAMPAGRRRELSSITYVSTGVMRGVARRVSSLYAARGRVRALPFCRPSNYVILLYYNVYTRSRHTRTSPIIYTAQHSITHSTACRQSRTDGHTYVQCSITSYRHSVHPHIMHLGCMKISGLINAPAPRALRWCSRELELVPPSSLYFPSSTPRVFPRVTYLYTHLCIICT